MICTLMCRKIEEALDISQYYPSLTDFHNHAKTAYRLLREAGLLQKRYPNSYRMPILQYSLDGDFIKEWSNVNSATQALKISGIGEACRGKQKSAGGYIWKYKD